MQASGAQVQVTRGGEAEGREVSMLDDSQEYRDRVFVPSDATDLSLSPGKWLFLTIKTPYAKQKRVSLPPSRWRWWKVGMANPSCVISTHSSAGFCAH